MSSLMALEKKAMPSRRSLRRQAAVRGFIKREIAHARQAFGIGRRHKALRRIALELDGVGSGFCRQPHQPQGRLHVAFVIDADLGDDRHFAIQVFAEQPHADSRRR